MADKDLDSSNGHAEDSSCGSPPGSSPRSLGDEVEGILRKSLGNFPPEDPPRRGEQIARAMAQAVLGGESEIKDKVNEHGPDVLGFDRRNRPYAVESVLGTAHSGCPWTQLSIRARGNQGSQGHLGNWLEKQAPKLPSRDDDNSFAQMAARVARTHRAGKKVHSLLAITDRKKGVVELHTLNSAANGTVGIAHRATLSPEFMQTLFPPKE